ncbi:MAG TPA: nuclear transport factor 2 family protein [Pseudomonas sp.]|jgi:hypothetical protein
MTIAKQEIKAVQLTVQHYVEGMVYAREAALRQAFHPDCRIIGHYHGKLEWLTLDDFIESIVSEGPAQEGVEARWEVQTLDVTGDAAAVKVTDEYMGIAFTDYLSLLKIDKHWRIINKLYYCHA